MRNWEQNLPTPYVLKKNNVASISCHAYPGANLSTLKRNFKALSITHCTDLLVFPSSLKWELVDRTQHIKGKNKVSVPNEEYLDQSFGEVFWELSHEFLERFPLGRLWMIIPPAYDFAAYNTRLTRAMSVQLRKEFAGRYPSDTLARLSRDHHTRIRTILNTPGSPITVSSIIDLDSAINLLPSFVVSKYRKFCSGTVENLANTHIFTDGIHPSPLLVNKCWILILKTLTESTLVCSAPTTAIAELPPMVARLTVGGGETIEETTPDFKKISP